MRISDWSSDGCSSDLRDIAQEVFGVPEEALLGLEAVNIPLPPYSTDRLAANLAMTKVWAKGGEVRARLDAELTRLADMGDDTPADYRGLSTADRKSTRLNSSH